MNSSVYDIKVKVLDDAERASAEAARLIADQISREPKTILGLATGGTPVGCYQQLIAMHRDGLVDFQDVATFNLDEYIGLSPEHPQSFRYFMQKQLFDHINVNSRFTFVPDGLADDIELHCRQYESMIESAGGIDLQLLGIGHNGHIAFNEPGSPADSRTRSVQLTAETIEMNARFFDSIDEVPRRAITMGVATILEADQILLLALGEDKSEAVARMVEGPVTEDHPASLLQTHQDVTVVTDGGAASRLSR